MNNVPALPVMLTGSCRYLFQLLDLHDVHILSLKPPCPSSQADETLARTYADRFRYLPQ